MRFFVTGVCGQLGHDTVIELKKRGYEVTGSDIADRYNGSDGILGDDEYISLDITDETEVKRIIASVQPDAVIHCAAWTAVDAAENEENREKVYAVNEGGTANIARACRAVGAKMLYISTDYVFSGEGDTPWEADCEKFSPQNVYADSKLKGEMAVRRELERYFIVRTAWVFGKNGSNFVFIMLQLAEKYGIIRVVNDQIGTPTYTEDLAKLIVDIAVSEKYGIYHATNSGGYISWYDFAKEIFRQAGKTVDVIPVTTEEYGLSKAKRPKNSRLDKSKLKSCGFEELPDWRDALRRYLEQTEG